MLVDYRLICDDSLSITSVFVHIVNIVTFYIQSYTYCLGQNRMIYVSYTIVGSNTTLCIFSNYTSKMHLCNFNSPHLLLSCTCSQWYKALLEQKCLSFALSDALEVRPVLKSGNLLILSNSVFGAV